jgi:hypothetical protein
VRCYLESLDVHDRHIVFVFDVNIEMALAVARGLFGCAAEVNRADDRAVLGIDHRGVGCAMAENVNPFRQRFE